MITNGRLHAKYLPELRAELLKKQDGICPLCMTGIVPDEAVVDHDHEEGHIRQVLHRSCNYAEGMLIHWATRTKARDPEVFIRAVIRYWQQDYRDNPKHPSYRTPQEKEIARLRKHMKTLKTEKGRQVVAEAIKQLIAQHP